MESLAIHIYWTGQVPLENDAIYQGYVKQLLQFYDRSVEDPTSISLGIPVYLHPTVPNLQEAKKSLQARYTVSIFLIDIAMDDSREWQLFVQAFLELTQTISSEHHILPINLTGELDILLPFGHLQSPGYQYSKDISGLILALLGITQSICRHLLHHKGGQITDQPGGKPVRIFISHAKKDGESLAQLLKDRIDDIPELNSFIDTKHLPFGYDFKEQLEYHIGQSVLLVLHTDEFSSREWCRREVLTAKQANRPVVVVNMFDKGEVRSFPYLGNVPHLHFPQISGGNDLSTADFAGPTGKFYYLDLIILNALRETLRFLSTGVRVSSLSKKLSLPLEDAHILSYPPELLNLISLSHDDPKLVIYPDPPLGQVELEVLKRAWPNLSFQTVTHLPMLAFGRNQTANLQGFRIGLSVSEHPKEQPYAETVNLAIQKAASDITKYLLIDGATINYGGNLNYEERILTQTNNNHYITATPQNKSLNFAHILQGLVSKYRMVYQDKGAAIKPIENYTFYPLNARKDMEGRRIFRREINFHDIPPPVDLGYTPNEAGALLDTPARTEEEATEHKYCWARCLTAMRQEMIAAEDARILLGGKWTMFRGRMSGVLEEALITLKKDQPLFVIGGFGGVAQGIAQALQGFSPPHFDDDFYHEQNPEYLAFIKRFNERLPAEQSDQRVDLQASRNFLHKKGISAEDFGLNNGLSKAENLRLFTSVSLPEIEFLLQKGLYHLTQTN